MRLGIAAYWHGIPDPTSYFIYSSGTSHMGEQAFEFHHYSEIHQYTKEIYTLPCVGSHLLLLRPCCSSAFASFAWCFGLANTGSLAQQATATHSCLILDASQGRTSCPNAQWRFEAGCRWGQPCSDCLDGVSSDSTGWTCWALQQDSEGATTAPVIKLPEADCSTLPIAKLLFWG